MTSQTKIRNTNKAKKLMKICGIVRIVGSGIKVKIWNVRIAGQKEGMPVQGRRKEKRND